MASRVMHRIVVGSLAGLLAISLLAMWSRQISTAPITSDAAQSLQMGIDLAHYGTLSMDAHPPLAATNYREPLLPITTALAVRIVDLTHGASEPASYFSGRLARYIKYQNLLWLTFFSLGTFWATRELTRSDLIALAAVAAVNVPLRPGTPFPPIDTLLSEIPSFGFLIFASMLLVVALTRRTRTSFLMAGLMFGLLTLVKAIALYAFIFSAAVLAALLLSGPDRPPIRELARNLALSLLGFMCVVGPWMYRNHVRLHTFQVTLRAGESLRERSLEDLMTAQERSGAWYLWAPVLKRPLGQALEFSPRDLDRGGRFERLNDQPDSALSQADLVYENAGLPDSTITFYRRARAEREQLEHQLELAGNAHPKVEADRLLERRALTVFARNPWQHVSITPLFLWRGATKTLALFAVAILIALWQRRRTLLMFMVPSLGITAAYAFFTPFFPRYDLPQHIVAIIAFVVAAKWLWDATRLPRYSGVRLTTGE